MTPRSPFALAIATVLSLLILGDALLSSYSRTHFIPSQKLAAAVRGGPNCVAMTGDSRMAAGLSLEALHERLHDAGADICVADLALGGTGLAGQAVEVRAYLTRVRGASLLVLGVVAESLLPTDEADPSEWTGSNAVTLELSDASDAEIHFPFRGVPSIRTIDKRERFYTERLSSYGVYRSLIWAKVQGAQDRLAGRKAVSRNNFGNLEDMAKLGEAFRRQGTEALQARESLPSRPLNPWFSYMREQARERGIPLVVVELPMPSRYREEVSDSALGRSLRAELHELLRKDGTAYVDLSRREWFNDGMLSDGLHLSREGSVELSHDLGTALAQELKSRSRAP